MESFLPYGAGFTFVPLPPTHETLMEFPGAVPFPELKHSLIDSLIAGILTAATSDSALTC